jgi:quinol monooxygenase YgiN
MSVSLIVSAAGALVVAIGLVMLLVRAARTPRGDVISWAAAMAGLLISLGAQAAGHLQGFDPITFRTMETGAEVIAPLALILGLAQAVARTRPGRFAGWLLIPAFSVLPLVVFITDPLSSATFSKAWPPPGTYYQFIPNALLEYGLAPITSLMAIVTVCFAIGRSRREFAWRAALMPVTAAGLAVLALAVPVLAPALQHHLGVHVPLSSLFAALCVGAGLLTWYAGMGTAGVPSDALRDATLRSGDRGDRGDRGGYPPESYAPPPRYDPYDQPVPDHGRPPRNDLDHSDVSGFDRAVSPPGPSARRWDAIDQTGDLEAYREGGGYDGLFRDEPGHADGDRGYVGPRTGDHAMAVPPGAGPVPAVPPVPDGPAGEDPAREDLFGQIAIYTLIEDQVEEFDRLTEQVVASVRASEPATLVFIVHAVPSAPMQRILYEVYRDRDAYDRHLQQPYVTKFEADRRPYVLATNVIELGLQHAKVSPFPSVADLFGEPAYDTSGFERPDFTREYGSTTGQHRATGGAGR